MRKELILSLFVCIMFIANVAPTFAQSDPEITLDPVSVLFGTVWIGQSDQKVLTVINEGATNNLEVTEINFVDPDGQFEIVSGDETLPIVVVPNGGQHEITFKFTPTLEDLASVTLRLITNDPDESETETLVNGTGVFAPDINVVPPSHDYGAVAPPVGDPPVGDHADQTFYVSNLGGAPLTVTGISLDPDPNNDFSIQSGDEVLPFTLDSDDDPHQIVVRFEPQTHGPKSATLSIISNDPDPDEGQVDVDLDGTTPPDIDVVPASHPFGTVEIGDHANKTFEVFNLGGELLNVTDISLIGDNPDEFRILFGGDPFTLNPGDLHSIIVLFSPTSAGVKSATLRIESNDPDEEFFDVDLDGTTPTDIDVVPAEWDYYIVDVGDEKDKTFAVSNVGGADLNITGISLEGANADQFNIQSGDTPPSLPLKPGDPPHEIKVRFAPTSAGIKSATLRIDSNDPDENENPFDVPLSGRTLQDIDVDPPEWDYEIVTVGDSKSKTFAVSNLGGEPLEVTGVSLIGDNADQFEFPSPVTTPFILNPGDPAEQIVVRFSPTSGGIKSATLRIESDDPDEGQVDVPLSGTTPQDIDVVPPEWDYEIVPVDDTESKTFAVSNLGGEPLVVASVSLVGDNPDQFEISDDDPFTLAPGADPHQIEVSFAPTSVGTKNAKLRLVSDDPDEVSFDVPLSGQTPPDIKVLPTTLLHDYGIVAVGDSKSKTVSVSNVGGATLNVTGISLEGDHPDQFQILTGGDPFTLNPEDPAHEIVVLFSPTSAGIKSATLRIDSNDPDEEQVDVTLLGKTASDFPDIDVDPASWAVNIPVGDSDERLFTISNKGTTTLVISNIGLTESNDFSIIGDVPPPDVSLEPTEVYQVLVRFEPTSEGIQENTLRVVSNDPDENPFDVDLLGGSGVPDIEITPDSLIFEEVWIGNSEELTLNIANIEGGVLIVTEVGLAGLLDPQQFQIVSGGEPFEVSPGDIHVITVRFSPTSVPEPEEEFHRELLQMTTNDPDEDQTETLLRGESVLPPDIAVDPPSHNYGTIDIIIVDTPSISDLECPPGSDCGFSDKTFVVTNEGGATLEVSSTDLIGEDPDNFSIQSGGGSFSIEPGEEHEIVVRFKPILPEESKSAILQIVSNDPDDDPLNPPVENPLDVPLEGNGIPLDREPPYIVSYTPSDGSYIQAVPAEIEIQFSELMNTESVLKNSEFIRMNVTKDIVEMQASLCTFLYWFGYNGTIPGTEYNPEEYSTYEEKYDAYGCSGPYGVAVAVDGPSPVEPGDLETNHFDVTFNETHDRLKFKVDVRVGDPCEFLHYGDEYRMSILINNATDCCGNTLELNEGIDFTFSVKEQTDVIDPDIGATLSLLDGTINLDIPAGTLSGPASLIAGSYNHPSVNDPNRDDLPLPLWSEFGKIDIINAVALEFDPPVDIVGDPIEIRVNYDDSDVPVDYEESPRLYQRNGEKWELLVGSSVDNNVVSYDGVTELGDFAVLWGYPYGDAVPDGVIDLLDILAFSQDVALLREIFAPGESEPSDDPYMRYHVGNVHFGDDLINAQDTQEVIQVYLGVLDHFTILGPVAGPRLMVSQSPSAAHTAFLSGDVLSNRISVILNNATDVVAADVELTYNPRLLKISEISKTSFTSDSFMEYNDKNAGILRLVLVNRLLLSGAGSLVDVQFELMPGASSTAAFDSIKLTKVELNAGLIKTTLRKIPKKLTLLQNYPNPFNPETWIPYELNQTADVEIRIYNINGQVVRQLSLGQQLPGSYITKDKAVYWDGTNDEGEKVSSGVYFYQLKAGKESFVRKMVIMK